MGRVDKLDSSFSRSRSSSMSSLENISTESVTCLAFADSYTKKSGKYSGQNRLACTRCEICFLFGHRSVDIDADVVDWYEPGIDSNHFNNVARNRSTENATRYSYDHG